MKHIRAITAIALSASMLFGGTGALSFATQTYAAEAKTETGASADTDSNKTYTTSSGETVTCPAGWDADDPEWGRAYEQVYGEGNEGTISYGSASAGVKLYSATYPVSTKWVSKSTGKKVTYYHHADSVENAEPIPVIDVSYHNGSIDFDKVKAAGIEGVIIRAGYRGYSNGRMVNDSKFVKYMKDAKEAGLHIGVYFFSQAISASEAKAEANFVLKRLKDNDYSDYVDLPVVTDVENCFGDGRERLIKAKLSKSKLATITLNFLDTVKDAGYEGMVYSGSNFFLKNLDGDAIYDAGYPLWMARYNNYAFSGGSNFYKNVQAVRFWQCSSTAKVSGISGSVDLDYWYRPTDAALTAESGNAAGNTAQTPVVKVAPKSVAPAKVTNVKKIAANTKSITVNWDAAKDADGYQVLIANSKSGTYKELEVPKGKRHLKIENLAAGTEYSIRVRAFSVEDAADFNNKSARVYGAKSDLILAQTNRNQEIQMITKTSMNMRKYAGTSSKKMKVVKKGKIVKVLAYTRDSSGKVWVKVSYSGKVGYISKVGLKYPVAKVTGQKASATAKNQTTISWKKVKGAKCYCVYRSTKPDSGYVNIGKTTKTKLISKKLKSKTTYYYKVRAFKKVSKKYRCGLYSDVLTVKTK